MLSAQQEELRRRSVEMLAKSLAQGKEDPDETAGELARQIEDVLWRQLTTESYKDRVRSLFLNIKANSDLKAMLLGQEVDLSRLATIPVEDLATDARRAEDERMFEEMLHSEVLPDRESIEPRPPPEVRRDMVQD